MALEASDAIPPLTKQSSVATKCITKKDIIQVVKSNTKRLAEIKVWGDGQEIGSNAVSISMETTELTNSVREISQPPCWGGSKKERGI